MPRISEDFHPGFQYLRVPAEYSDHPVLQAGPFYTRCPSLCLTVSPREVGQTRFDTGLWAMELAMTRACGSEDGVGVWNGQRISFPLLRFQRLAIDPAIGGSLGWTDQQVDALNTVGSERDARSATTASGYAGWLLTNRTFLAEHQDILNTWQREISEFHIPVMGFVVPDVSVVPEATNQPVGTMEEFLKAFEAFFVRWRLAGLTSPYLPSPLRPQIPVTILSSVLGHMRGGGQDFYFPRYVPRCRHASNCARG